MGGGDFCPENIYQVIMASIGVFMAAYINANIFGELNMLLETIGIESQRFDLKKSQMDTAMINLKLPAHIKQQVRSQLFMFAPLEVSQRSMIELMDMVPPSYQSKIIGYRNKFYLNKYTVYERQQSFVQALITCLEINFFYPEQALICQNSGILNRMIITGVGCCQVYQFNQLNQLILIGEADEGQIFGEEQMMFPNEADYTLIS